MRALALASLLIALGPAVPVAAPRPADDGKATDQYWDPAFRIDKNNTAPKISPGVGSSVPPSQPPLSDDEEIGIPFVDVDAACRRLGHPMTVAYCVRQEQAAYDTTRYLWRSLPPGRRRYCIEKTEDVKRTAPHAYYSALEGFARYQAQFEQDERDRVSPPRFRR